MTYKIALEYLLSYDLVPLNGNFIYKNDLENSHKFWNYCFAGFLYNTHWGRIGSKGSFKNHMFDTSIETREKMICDITSKLNKGYQISEWGGIIQEDLPSFKCDPWNFAKKLLKEKNGTKHNSSS